MMLETSPQALVQTSNLRSLRYSNLFAFAIWAFGVLETRHSFRNEPYVAPLCYALEKAATDAAGRLIVALPPRHGKSKMAIALAAWMIGRNPAMHIQVVSYGAELAEQHMSGFRQLLRHPEYKHIFPRLKIKRDTQDLVETTLGGSRRSITPRGPVTGMGADLIIVDDAIKAHSAHYEAEREAANSFFDSSIYSRLDNKAEGSIVVIGQRLHERDMIGHLLERSLWTEMIMPAIADELQTFPSYFGQTYVRRPGDLLAPGHEPIEVLNDARRLMGEAAYSAQYQQNPIPPGGNRIHSEWFGYYERMPIRDELLSVVQSWDTAMKNVPGADYSVCMTFGTPDGEEWWLLDVARARLDFPDLLARAHALYRRWLPDKVIIEQAATGTPLRQQLQHQLGRGASAKITGWQPQIDKVTRVEAVTSLLSEGVVVLPEQAPWLGDLRRELSGFPNAAHDDQVDALAQFLEWLNSSKGRGFLRTDPRTGQLRPGMRPRGMDTSRFNNRRLINR